MPSTSPNGAITVDDSHFPLVEVVARDGHRDADWAWLLQRYERLFAQRLRYAHLVDARFMTKPMEPTARKLITQWMAENIKNTALWNVGTSVVMSSGIIRGALTALTWFVHQPVPMQYPATYSEALDWCVARLDAEGIVVPQAIRKRQLMLLSDPEPIHSHAPRQSLRSSSG